jgi:hypothetical protein
MSLKMVTIAETACLHAFSPRMQNNDLFANEVLASLVAILETNHDEENPSA